MSRIGAAIKNLPIAVERPTLIKQLITLNVGAYAYYQVASGPEKGRFNQLFTLTEESGPQSLLFFHFAHNSIVPLLFNVGVLASVGGYHVATHGCNHFAKIFGIGAAGAALFAGFDMRRNPNQRQAGGLGASAGLLTYHIFRNPSVLYFTRVSPLSILALFAFYGVYADDKAVLGGLGAGYLAFLAAL